MARRLIGLDVGTNAVTVAEVEAGDPPRLHAFGQVALPTDAMREGEVVDEAAVAAAVERLRTEVGLRRAPVRVGLATPRLVVRQIEMPVMNREEVAGALRFQAQELVPIPLEEAVLDFAILDTVTPGDGAEPFMRVLLAAVQEATVARLVGAVTGGGFGVQSVDLVPLALIRALARPVENGEPGAEGIVSFGAGVTVVAVHELGTPRFVRVLGTAGRDLTDAIAGQLQVPVETAEALKRQLEGGDDDVAAQARGALERPLAALLDEVRTSLDFYRNQPGAARLLRVVVTGGGAQLPGLADRLSTLVGVPVALASPRDHLAIGDIGFEPDEVERLDPYLAAAVGLALGGVRGPAVDLLPRAVRAGAPRARMVVAGVAAAAVLAALLAIPTIGRQSKLSDEKDALQEQQTENAQLQQRIDGLSAAQVKQDRLDATRGQITTLLQNDVSWARMLQEIAKTIPNDVWLTAFQASVTEVGVPGGVTTTTAPAGGATTTAAGATTTTAPGAAPTFPTLGGPTGTVSFTGVGLEYPSIAAWLERIAAIPSFTGLWVPSASEGAIDTRDVVNFTSTAQLTAEARSDRLEEFTEAAG